MSDWDDSTDLQQLPEFAGVDLSRSYVLSWHVESDALLIDVDLYLTPEHPFFEKPRPAEKVCIRPACIEFPFCEVLVLEGTEQGELIDIIEIIGHGALHGLRRLSELRYEITGEFGTVFVEAEQPVLKLKRS